MSDFPRPFSVVEAEAAKKKPHGGCDSCDGPVHHSYGGDGWDGPDLCCVCADCCDADDCAAGCERGCAP